MKQFKVYMKDGLNFIVTACRVTMPFEHLIYFEDEYCLTTAIFPIENVICVMEVEKE